MRSAGCVFVGVVFAAILFFGGHVTVLTSQKPPSAADVPAAPSAQVAWIIFVDDLHLDFVSTGRLRDVLRTAASTLGEGAALVGIQSSGPPSVSLPPSTDLDGRDAAIRRIVGNGLRPGDFLVGNAPGAARESVTVRTRHCQPYPRPLRGSQPPPLQRNTSSTLVTASPSYSLSIPAHRFRLG